MGQAIASVGSIRTAENGTFVNDSPLYKSVGPVTYLIVNLPLIALLFVLIAFVLSFRAKSPETRLRWRMAAGTVLMLLVASCAIVASTLRLGG